MATIQDPKIMCCKRHANDGSYYEAVMTCTMFCHDMEMVVRATTIGSGEKEIRNKFRMRLERVCITDYDSDNESFRIARWLTHITDTCPIEEMSINELYRRKASRSMLSDTGKVYRSDDFVIRD